MQKFGAIQKIVIYHLALLEKFSYKLLHLFATALPNITTQPVSMTIREGDLNVIAVSCLAIGIGSIHYQWEKYHLFNNS